jgi:hypothetical protein
MPVELFRALILGDQKVELSKDYESHWKFYGEIQRD